MASLEWGTPIDFNWVYHSGLLEACLGAAKHRTARNDGVLLCGALIVQLVAAENVASVNLLLYIIQASIVAVCNDRVAHLLELVQVVHNLAAEKGLAVVQRGLVDHDLGTLGFDALHDTLNRGLTEVVRAGLHGQTINADHSGGLLCLAVLVVLLVAIVTGHAEHAVSNEVLTGAVGLHMCILVSH